MLARDLTDYLGLNDDRLTALPGVGRLSSTR
jgi:hypothetical protein